MCWNEWKINFPSFSFWDMAVFVFKIGQFFMNFDYKIDHNSKKYKIGKIWYLIFHSVQHIPHFSCKDGHFWAGGGGLCNADILPSKSFQNSEKLRNILKHMFFFLISLYFRLIHFSTKLFIGKKIAQILIKFFPTCVSEDSKKK